MNKKFLSLISVIVMLAGITISTFFPNRTPLPAEAADPVFSVTGWGYSDMPDQVRPLSSSSYSSCFENGGLFGFCGNGLGWISMTGTNLNAGGGSYGVTLDPVTGKFGGYAWSEHGGWVNFAPTATPPVAPNGRTESRSAFVDPVCLANKTKTCVIKGWIRFENGGIGEWDGWVSMQMSKTAGRPGDNMYAVSLSPEVNGIRQFSGFAWGDTVVGWVDFSKAQLEIADVCPDTKFNGIGNPKNETVDPKTAGTQTTLPAGYTVQTINGTEMCAIFGCTDKTAANYVKTATVDDGSCLTYDATCPDGTLAPGGDVTQCPGEGETTCTTTSPTYNPFTKTCQECNPEVSSYDPKTGLCEVTPPLECTPTSPDYNPVSGKCGTCHPGVTGYNETTGRCTIPGGHKKPVYIET